MEQHDAELEYAQGLVARDRKLMRGGAGSDAELREAERMRRVAGAQKEQAQAQKRAREALGTREAEAEVARREKELADARAALTLLTVPPRSEEVAAEQARVARLGEEVRYLTGLRDKQVVVSPVAGVIATPHLKERRGQYVKEGDLICQVEDPSGFEAEIALPEEEVARVRPGQAVSLKARSLPFETFEARVSRAAPAVRAEANRPPGAAEGQGVVTVYCGLGGASDLRPGMTGYARIATGRRSVAGYLLDRGLRFLRTEFWW
jgi:multidrug resistance efflux pump